MFLQIMCRLPNCVYKSKLASICWTAVSNSNIEIIFKILEVLLVCFGQSITVQIESEIHLGNFNDFYNTL